VLKWLTLFLFAYVACLFMVKVPWGEALGNLVVPSVHWDKDYLTTVVAVLGTTISLTCSFGRLPRKPRTSGRSRPGRY
jgi:Mn2+/Fe2+ NRAMP family transporter